MELSFAAQTDVGRVRANNEDAYFADADLGLFIVCDGMGGHNAGEVASQMACDVISQEIIKASRVRQNFLESGSPEDAELLRDQVAVAINNACRQIFKRASREPALSGMGTTCSLVLLCGHEKAILGHVGDSRLYLARQNHLYQVSNDHTYVNELIRRGSLAPEKAINHPQGNVLSRALGIQPGISVETMVFSLAPNDTYLLCSDGMHHYLSDAKGLIPAMTHTNLEKGLEALVNTALVRGGHDNITGVLFRTEDIGNRDASTTIERRLASIKHTALFAHLNYNELLLVEGQTQLARALAGQAIVREGDSSNEFYITLSGEVDIEHKGRITATLKAGAYFGEASLIGAGLRRTTVRARTQVQLLMLRRNAFSQIIGNEPILAAKLLWSLTQMVSERQNYDEEHSDYYGESATKPTVIPPES